MTELEAKISCLDLAYQKLSGLSFGGREARGVVNWRERAWYDFITAGHTVQELEEVVLWLKPQIREGKRNLGCLRFSNLISQLDRFEEELSMARAEKRNQKPPPSALDRVKALRERPVSQTTPADHRDHCASISEVIAAMRKAADKPQ